MISPDVGRSMAPRRYRERALAGATWTDYKRKPAAVDVAAYTAQALEPSVCRFGRTSSRSALRSSVNLSRSVRSETYRLHGEEPGCAPGGVEPAHGTHDHRQPDAQTQEEPGSWPDECPRLGNGFTMRVPHPGQGATHHPREQAQVRAFQGYQGQDVGLRPTVRAQHAEFHEPLCRTHQHRVHDADDADQAEPG